jgi:transcriptional regulator with XRE-family HTH domain
MTVKANNVSVSMSDSSIIKKIGEFIRQKRLSMNKTQSQLANEAGINRWTISQVENGKSVTLLSLIQMLRVLDAFNVLDGFHFEERISPIEYAKLKERKRKRARPKNTAAEPENDLEW